MINHTVPLFTCLTLSACGLADRSNNQDDGGQEGGFIEEDGQGGGESDGGDGSVFFDVGDGSISNGGNEGGIGDCEEPPPVDCGEMEGEGPLQAMGINCEPEPTFEGGFNGNEQSMLVHEGKIGPYEPKQGNFYTILSSGRADQLTWTREELENDSSCDPLLSEEGSFNCPSTHFMNPEYEFMLLPEPLTVDKVSEEQNCEDDESLIGKGDCSNTLFEQWDAAGVDAGEGGSATGMTATIANDYAEIRLSTSVPSGIFGMAFDFAYMSVEYPQYYGSRFNDMFIAWLDSESWTGNIAFDEAGNPISLNAGFLDYKDAPNDIDCPAPCEAEELKGLAMEGHAATKWLTTETGVHPGEEILLVLAIFDMSDGILDSYVLLDNFRWTCEGDAPSTIPIG